MRKALVTILLLAWMLVIFLMSAKAGNESTTISHSVGRMIGKIVIVNFDNLPENEQESYAESIDHFVRKTAHAAEYTILAVLSVLAFYVYERKHYGIDGWMLSVLYAASDELHQLFVPGRSGMLSDVILDSAGALAGAFLIVLIIKLVKKKKGCY